MCRQHSGALLPPSGHFKKHPHAFDTHTERNLIWQDHCAKSPFSSLNKAGSKRYLKQRGEVRQADTKPHTGGGQISKALFCHENLKFH